MDSTATATGSIARTRAQLAKGAVKARDLADGILARLDAVDAQTADGPSLNAVVVRSATMQDDAARLDAERDAGHVRGPLHGIPYTVKDSFAVEGMTLAAGSPAFADLVARRDAVVVERLRAAGALLVGKTNMPPMAIGGGQAGLYGRTRSPYSRDWLAAAWHSGSSIGSAVAVAAGLCAFGIGEETVSSGRSPASNNALVAYTPSWGVIPSAGNWPLHPHRDVVVPHTLRVDDLLDVLAVIAGPDHRDLWHRQGIIDVSAADRVAEALRADAVRAVARTDLRGMRIGVPRIYVGDDHDGVAAVPLRGSVRTLWDAAAARMREAGAVLLDVDFPLVEAYEDRHPGRPSLEELGLLPTSWARYELGPLLTAAWQEHLDVYGDGRALSTVDPALVRPTPPGALDDTVGDTHPGRDTFDFAAVLGDPPPTPDEIAATAAAPLRGLVRARDRLFDAWMEEVGIDFVAFPANADVGRWDSDTNPESAAASWADGAVFSTGNHVLRRVGIPTATLPMGIMSDIGMPVGLTIAASAYDDAALLSLAAAVEAVLPDRVPPPLP
ncbi:amidase family protein [Microbacterium oryzae]|uniref:amidase family protein n=1 Tax=Microbacterium oryzae TaxID=743009 RepID=UPI0025B137FF|nr:amidase family protein [Microbacterium oryzae]MDN3310176.1 amidase family protein [Microbacterium oryzae]